MIYCQRQKAIGPWCAIFFSDPIYLFQIALVLSATMYILFGLVPWLGFASSAIIVLLLFGNVVIFPILLDTDQETFLTVWFLITTTVIFASIGHSDAHNIRFGDRSKFPLVITEVAIPEANQDELRLVRRLSSGMLVAT